MRCPTHYGPPFGNPYIWGFPKLGVPFWAPYNKDYNISGSVLGFPYLGKLPYDGALHRGHVRAPCFTGPYVFMLQ